MAIITITGRKPKVSSSDGHGMDTSGKRSPIFPSGSGLKSETGNFMHENEFNRAVEIMLHEELQRCGFDTLRTAPTDADTSLQERASKSNAWGADFHLDIHANAFDGQWDKDGEGLETLYYSGSSKGKACAQILQKYILQGTKLKDRGIKPSDGLYMLRKTNAPACLVELGFMDDIDEIKLLLSDSYRRECAIELAKGICEIFGKPYVASTTSKAEAKPAVPAPAKESYEVIPQWEQEGFEFLVDECGLSNNGRWKPNDTATIGFVGQMLKRLRDKGAL